MLRPFLSVFFLVIFSFVLYCQSLDSAQFQLRYDSIESLNHAGKYEEALDMSRNLYEQCLSEFGEQHKFTAFASMGLGVACIHNSQYEKADSLLNNCIKTSKALFGTDYIELSTAYNALGAVYVDTGKPHKAVPLYKEAIRILKLSFPIDHPSFSQSFHNLGIAYDIMGYPDSAIVLFYQSLKNKLANPNFSAIHISNTYNNIAAAYQNMGDLEKAINAFQGSLGILELEGKQNTQEYVNSLMNLGIVWFEVKNNFLAKKFLDEAYKRADSVFGEEHLGKGRLLLNLGITYLELNEIEKADTLIKAAKNIFQSNLGENSFFDVPCSIALGHMQLKKNNPDSSIILFGHAYDIAKMFLGETHSQTILTLNNLGTAYERTGNLDRSSAAFRQAIQDYEKKFKESKQPIVPNIDYLDANHNLANSLLGDCIRNGKTSLQQEIQSILAHSFSVLDELKASHNDRLTHQSLMASGHSLFEIAIKSASFEDTKLSFTYSERAKGGNLLSTISEQNSISYKDVPDSLLQKEHSLKKGIAFFEKLIAESIDNLNFSELINYRYQLDSLKTSFGALKQLLKELNPDYHDLKYNPTTISVSEVQRQLLTPNEALLEYFVGDSSIFIFVIKPDDYQMVEVKKDFPLEAWVDTLRHHIYQNQSTYSDSYVQAATDLYDKLVQPVAGLLPERLIVIPDGVLGYVPFDALLTGRPKDLKRPDRYDYLLKKHQISYCYSATLLQKMRERQHRHAPSKEFVAFSPYYTGSVQELEYLQPFQFSPDSLYAGLRSWTPSMADELQASAAEVKTVTKKIGGDAFYGSEATEARFDSIAGQYRIVHLATHGIADNRVGDYSFLAFYILPDSTENELLYVRDLYNLELNADMVVLSACETGLGELQRGEGIISLARAFAYAGAKSIVNTLWKVNDQSTSELMVLFYGYLKGGKEKDEALRLAKLAYIKQHGKRAMPFFWAGVIPVGDMGRVW